MTPPTQSLLEMTAWEAELHAAEAKNFEVILHLETAACFPVLDARMRGGGVGAGAIHLAKFLVQPVQMQLEYVDQTKTYGNKRTTFRGTPLFLLQPVRL